MLCKKPVLPFKSPLMQVGQEIEVRPGIVSKDQEGKLMCKPIFSKIVSLFAEHNDLQYAAPGGLIGETVSEQRIPTASRSLYVVESKYSDLCRCGH